MYVNELRDSTLGLTEYYSSLRSHGYIINHDNNAVLELLVSPGHAIVGFHSDCKTELT